MRFNRACERSTGYTFDEVRGHLLWDVLLVPEQVDMVKGVLEELRAGQFASQARTGTSVENFGLYADLWGKNSASPYFNRSFGQKWVAPLAFEHILAIEWGKSPS